MPQENKPAAGGTTGSTHSALAWIRLNYDYFKSIPGILKIVQAILGIFCMIFASPAILAGTHWFLFVVVTSFIATLIWMSVYFLGVREALQLPINWILTEFLNTVVVAILYFTAFVIQLTAWSPNYQPQFRNPNITAGVRKRFRKFCRLLINMISSFFYSISQLYH
ncbi:uncharacterized protein LOC111046873 [Nilaparvata lugens]|uniref:uncharacterized protein LOC111046873 n=1 Tax=Nilaparvata lugens TaxID=108931 RepID=UPI00193DBB21|nr:uncharacterized protein LOC111046873 [Nilaparvata lugens]